MRNMDAVITYVNGFDPLWRKSFEETTGKQAMAKRFRDWGTLPYLLRGIQEHIPSVDKVFLIVSSESQVPSWVDREKLNVVYHKDIIPEQFLPTFNSSTIEMFMHRIPDLGEEFLYFNDDMFPVMDCKKEDFFKDGKSAIGFAHHLLAANKYKKRVRNSDRQARKVAGKKPGLFFIRPQHTCSPMIKSMNEELFHASRDVIYSVISRLRNAHTFNQYLFLDYQYLAGLGVSRRISNRHISLAAVSPERLAAAIVSPDRQIVSINDVEMSPERFHLLRRTMLEAFSRHFPEKSVYER